jgi:hypothetical protein
MEHYLINQPILDCHYSPTGKAYQALNGGCSCHPVTPGLTGQDHLDWTVLHNAWFNMTIWSQLHNLPELESLAEDVKELCDSMYYMNDDGSFCIPDRSSEFRGRIYRIARDLEEVSFQNMEFSYFMDTVDDLVELQKRLFP